jgi:hypothetical protein
MGTLMSRNCLGIVENDATCGGYAFDHSPLLLPFAILKQAGGFSTVKQGCESCLATAGKWEPEHRVVAFSKSARQASSSGH